MLITDTSHSQQHDQIAAWMYDAIRNNRDSIGLDPAWAIEGRVVCQEELPHQEGVIWWDAEMKYARMLIRCDLPNGLMLWVLHHELYELLLWETADLYMTTSIRARLPRQFGTYLQEQYRAARNRQIELLLYRHLGYRRPGHLMEEIVLPSSLTLLYDEEKGA